MTKIIMTIIVVLILAPLNARSDDYDYFSRANCFNNESITYNYWSPPEYRAVASQHYDTENNNAMHTTCDQLPVSCLLGQPCPNSCTVLDQCMCGYTQNTRHAAIHMGEEGSLFNWPWSDRWFVRGGHSFWAPGAWPYTYVTQATDCNGHLDQFY